MTDKADSRDNTQSALLMALIRSIASRDLEEASRQLDAVPELAKQVAAMGATRQDATLNYFKEIEHYVYAGDTALHIAAAAYAREIAEKLLYRRGCPHEKPPRCRTPSLCGRRHAWFAHMESRGAKGHRRVSP